MGKPAKRTRQMASNAREKDGSGDRVWGDEENQALDAVFESGACQSINDTPASFRNLDPRFLDFPASTFAYRFNKKKEEFFASSK